ncbi:OstA-like protein [Prevotella dentasini]
MTLNNDRKAASGRHRILFIWILCLFGLCMPIHSWGQKPVGKKGDKVYLDYADNLRHNQYEMPDVQVAKGNVKFRYKDMTLLCDSAFLNDKQSSFKAFGHVSLRRTDGTHITCSRAYYEGMSQMMRARERVVVRQPGKNLRCDSLDYNMTTDVANYFGGRGTLVYGINTVVADMGDYNTKTHEANFYGDVVIRTPKYRINTPTAHGNTETGLIHVLGESVIRTVKGEVVHTKDGTYDSKTDHLELVGRSTITSPQRDVEGDNITYNSTTGDAEGHGNVKIVDKVNRRTITGEDVVYNARTGYSEGRGKVKVVDEKVQRTITGDEVVYNAKTGHSEGHGNVKIVDKLKNRTITGRDLIYNSNTHIGEGRGDVYYIDYKNKHAFYGDYVHYTDSAAIAFGGKPGTVAKDFSQGDTLFVHADTVSMKAFRLNTPEVYREVYGVNNVRAYRTDVQSVCGFLVANSKDSCLTLHEDPVVWNGNRQLVGDSIKAYMNGRMVRKAYVYGNAFSIEALTDGQHFNQISSRNMEADFVDGKIRRVDAISNVLSLYYRADEKDSTLLVGVNYSETDTLRMFMTPERRLDRIWTSKIKGTFYPMLQIPADKTELPNFHWYEQIRPRDKFDIYRRAGRKDEGVVRRRETVVPPRQRILDR